MKSFGNVPKKKNFIGPKMFHLNCFEFNKLPGNPEALLPWISSKLLGQIVISGCAVQGQPSISRFLAPCCGIGNLKVLRATVEMVALLLAFQHGVRKPQEPQVLLGFSRLPGSSL